MKLPSKKAGIPVCLGLLALLLSLPQSAGALEYSFTKIADSSVFGIFPAPIINDPGTVAFFSERRTGLGGGFGIFTGSGGPVTTIVDNSGPFSGIGRPRSINNAGTVAFRGFKDTVGEGIFTSDGLTTTLIAETTGPFLGFNSDVSINNIDTVAFLALLDAGGQGNFISTGGVITPIAVPGGPFTSINSPPALNDAGTIAFIAGLSSGGQGIVVSDGTTTTILLDTTGPFSGFSGIAVNDTGTVAALASLGPGEQAIITTDGTTTTVVVDNISGPFSNLGGSFSINNAGTVAFNAILDTGDFGIFIGPDPIADKVIGNGDPLFGSTVTSLGFRNGGLNNPGQIAFFALFADPLPDRQFAAFIRADPVPEPSTILDHFLSYEVRRTKRTPKFEKQEVILTDQFESDVLFKIKKVKKLYNPADKNGEGIIDLDTHLVGYKIKRAKGEPKHEKRTNIEVVNQFGTIFVDTKKPDRLLVPSLKDLDNPIPDIDVPDEFLVDHFKCYKVEVSEGSEFPEGIQVDVVDQFNQPKLFNVKKPERLCNPVDKNGEGIINPDAHLMCYKVKPAEDEPKHIKMKGIHTNNQFGPLQVDTKKEAELCVPSTKTLP